jgi:hypothetical protein
LESLFSYPPELEEKFLFLVRRHVGHFRSPLVHALPELPFPVLQLFQPLYFLCAAPSLLVARLKKAKKFKKTQSKM